MADTRGEIISFHSLCVTVLIHYAVVTSVSTFTKSLPILPANNLAVLGDANARRRNSKYLSYFLCKNIWALLYILSIISYLQKILN